MIVRPRPSMSSGMRGAKIRGRKMGTTLQPLAAMATNPAGGREVIGHAPPRHKPSAARVDGEAWSIQTIPNPWQTTSAAYRRHVAWRHRLELTERRIRCARPICSPLLPPLSLLAFGDG